MNNSETIYKKIDNAESLPQLLSLHKKAWLIGFQNENLGPDKYGMFRTKDIMNMTENEVYLGNIYGLWTFPISEWNKHKATDPNSYGIVFNQYRNLLLSNVKAITEELKNYIEEYEM